MPKCLIVKTSSLGDVLHTLPAITEAKKHCPDMQFDWVVERAFAEIPAWHLTVDRVIVLEIRKWRKNPFKFRREIREFYKTLKAVKYDYVIDAQGLLKSAWVTRKARGVKYGFDSHSARERWASWFYRHKIAVEPGKHAIWRTRMLFGAVFNYRPDDKILDYGIKYDWQKIAQHADYVVFLHATTWVSKFWPLDHWVELSQLFKTHYPKLQILLPWGNETELVKAKAIAGSRENITVLDSCSLTQLAETFSHSKLVISVDTGLAHLAAACNTPILSLYGPTSAKLTGSMGVNAHHLSSSLTCSPCFKRVCPITKDAFAPCQVSLTPTMVFKKMQQLFPPLRDMESGTRGRVDPG
ncbi:MAG: lipopolysaccharide heptosyltransferase I, partial [Francisellaceae bacterium]